MPSAEVISERRYGESGDMRTHVPSVRQQSHRVGGNADDDLEDHHAGRDRDDDAGSPLRHGRIQGKVMRMPEMRMIDAFHGAVKMSGVALFNLSRQRRRAMIQLSVCLIARAEGAMRGTLGPASRRGCKRWPRRKAGPTRTTAGDRRYFLSTILPNRSVTASELIARC